MRRLPTLTWVRFCLDTSVLVGPGYRDVVHEAGHHEHDLHRQVSHLHRSDVVPVWDRKASLSPVCLQTNQLVFPPPEQLPVSMELGWLVSVEPPRWAVNTLTVHLLFSFLVHKGLTVWPQIRKCPNPNLWKRCWRSAWGIFPTFPLTTSIFNAFFLVWICLCGLTLSNFSFPAGFRTISVLWTSSLPPSQHSSQLNPTVFTNTEMRALVSPLKCWRFYLPSPLVIHLTNKHEAERQPSENLIREQWITLYL